MEPLFVEKILLKTETKIGTIFTWNEVSEIHKVRNGIYQKKEKLISLLTDFGKINPCYPDFEGENSDTIFYTGAGRHGDQKLDAPNRAMFAAIKRGTSVPLFNKLTVGRWEFLGFWRIIEGKYIYEEKGERMVWKFKLQREK